MIESLSKKRKIPFFCPFEMRLFVGTLYKHFIEVLLISAQIAMLLKFILFLIVFINFRAQYYNREW